MIVFDLKCAAAHHVFEAWFGSSADYEDQRLQGLLSCPLCGDREVSKAAMAPTVPAKANRSSANPVQSVATSDSLGDMTPSEAKQMLAAMARLQTKILENSHWVGQDFTREARAMHDGECDHRPIHGEASAEEVRDMIEDGIAVAPLLLPVLPPESQN